MSGDSNRGCVCDEINTRHCPVHGQGSKPGKKLRSRLAHPPQFEFQVRSIWSGWSLRVWRESQYRPGTDERYRTLIVDLFTRRFEFRRRVRAER